MHNHPLIIYISGFRQHAGKTVTSLGLLSLFRKYYSPAELAYIKPVGQELVNLPDGKMIDKDVRLIEEFSLIPDMNLDKSSPVRLGRGFTRNYLDAESPEKETETLTNNIIDSFKSLSNKKIIIAEGTGHPGVGSIVGLSNAKVANLIHGNIIYLSGGGIGKALDMLEIDLSYYLLMKSRLKGLIFNKLIPDKIPTVKKYITENLIQKKFPGFKDKLRIFGYLPQIEELNKPSMKTLITIFKEAAPVGNTENLAWKIPCKKIKVISMPAKYLNLKKYLNPNDLVLIGASSRKRISMILKHNRELGPGNSIGGIILTCMYDNAISMTVRNKIKASGIPAFYVKEDTSSTEQKVLNCFENTKIQLFDTDKVDMASKLFHDYFDYEKFADTFNLRKK